MPDSSQEQQFGNIDLTKSKLVSVNAGGGSIVDSPGAQITRKSYWSLFGGHSVSPGIDWDWAQRIVLEPLKEEIDERLDKSLLGFIPVDGLNVKVSSQEDSPFLELGLLEPQKTVSVDGTIDDIDSRMPIIQTYAKTGIGKKLLILGTPGAGKTITLLKLAEQLVGEAIAQPQTVIPIIFELSTWRDGQEIEAWLIEQLYENYGGNRKRKIYETWVERRVLLPLLDGLDELGMVRQKACTEKVNEFARTYPQVVVCCRVKEFQQAGVNLSNLRGKVKLQPLIDRQIELYLHQMGKSGLWEQIQSVPEMGRLLEPVIDQENADYNEPGLLRVPLFISLAAQVYEPNQPLKGKADLFERYIDRQLSWDVRVDDRDRKEFKGRKWAYKSIDDEPNRHQTQKYLRWLSQKVLDAEITEFKLEWIRYGITHNETSYSKQQAKIPQPREISWLDTKNQLSMHRFLYRSLIILFFIIANKFYSIFFLDFCMITILNLVLLITMFLVGLFAGFLVDKVSKLLSGKSASQNLVGGMNFIFINPIKWVFKISRSNYIFSFLFSVVLFSLLATFLGLNLEYLTKPVIIMVKPHLINLAKENPLLAITLVGNSIIFFPLGLITQIFNEDVFLRKSDQGEFSENSENPEKGIGQTSQSEFQIFIFILYNQLTYFVGLMFYAGDPSSPFYVELPQSVSFPILPILFLMVLLGLPTILFNIDISIQVQFWQHLPRRLILYINGVVPWNLVRFLTYCHDRRLLQQIGGRYRFIHRELLEHFAGIEN